MNTLLLAEDEAREAVALAELLARILRRHPVAPVEAEICSANGALDERPETETSGW